MIVPWRTLTNSFSYWSRKRLLTPASRTWSVAPWADTQHVLRPFFVCSKRMMTNDHETEQKRRIVCSAVVSKGQCLVTRHKGSQVTNAKMTIEQEAKRSNTRWTFARLQRRNIARVELVQDVRSVESSWLCPCHGVRRGRVCLLVVDGHHLPRSY
jgi:hypothetical protein